MKKELKENYEFEEKLRLEFLQEFINLRHSLGLTQSQMANKSNVLRDKITKIEIGLYSPNIDSLFKILGPLGYTISITKIRDEQNE